jgi:hypothetical protein
VTRITVHPNDRMFDPLFKFLVIQSSFSLAHALMARGTTKYRAGARQTMECHAVDLEAHLPLREPMQWAIGGQTPSVIEFELKSKVATPADYKKVAELGKFLPYLVTPILMEFFEAHKQWLIDRYGGWKRLPPVAAFVHQLRNSIAHRGVRIDDPRMIVSWRGLNYSALDNGRSTIGHDLSTADVLVLMRDFSKELDEAGCPPPSELSPSNG